MIKSLLLAAVSLVALSASAQEAAPSTTPAAPAATATKAPEEQRSAMDPSGEIPEGVPGGISDYRVRQDVRESRFSLALYGQVSQFTYQNRPLLGNALELSATYALYSGLAASLAVAQAVDLNSGITILYTNFHAAVTWAFFGSFIQKKSVLMVNSVPTVVTQSGEGSLFAFDIGLDQYMFNGTSRIVPGTGIVAGLRYDRMVFSWPCTFSIRYGALVISETATTLNTAGMGLMMRF